MKASHILNILREFPKVVLVKVFPSLSYKGVINTQIRIYNGMRKRYSDVPEDEILNYVIISRIDAWPRTASKEEEYAHYKPLLENTKKTLRDVIWAIVEYEYILSRREYIHRRLLRMGLTPLGAMAETQNFERQVAEDIKESIEKKVRKSS